MVLYRTKKGYITFLGILIVAVIIILLVRLIMNLYFKQFYSEEKVRQFLPEKDTEVLDEEAVIADNTKKKVEELDRQLQGKIRQLDDFIK